MKPFYRHILARSWDISRSNLLLWPLAFCTAFIGVSWPFQIFFDMSGGNNALTSSFWYIPSNFVLSTFVGWNQAFDQVPWSRVTVADAPFVLLLFLLLCIVIGASIIFISSEGGLIYALAELYNKKKTSYLISFRKGVDKFWSLLFIEVIYSLLYVIIISLVIMPILYNMASVRPAWSLALSMLNYLILIPLMIILNLVIRYSKMYIMLYDAPLKDAFMKAWTLFSTNWVISIETGFLIFMALIATAFTFYYLVIYGIMLLFLMFGTFLAISGIMLQLTLIVMLALLAILVAWFFTLFTALQTAIWVGVFRKLTTGEHQSKIHRLFSHLPWMHKNVL